MINLNQEEYFDELRLIMHPCLSCSSRKRYPQSVSIIYIYIYVKHIVSHNAHPSEHYEKLYLLCCCMLPGVNILEHYKLSLILLMDNLQCHIINYSY